MGLKLYCRFEIRAVCVCSLDFWWPVDAVRIDAERDTAEGAPGPAQHCLKGLNHHICTCTPPPAPDNLLCPIPPFRARDCSMCGSPVRPVPAPPPSPLSPNPPTLPPDPSPSLAAESRPARATESHHRGAHPRQTH